MSTDQADEALSQAHRLYFGRLVGWLFRYTGDLGIAEDAVASAFASALTAWRTEIPESPEAWLRVAARNSAMSALRRAERTVPITPEQVDFLAAPEAVADAVDRRLALMLVCAHPALDPRVRAPLMLQAVLGVDAARIAPVFLVSPTTMGQRLSRAKAKIRDSGIRFRIPDNHELASRLPAVCDAVYAAYGVSDPTAQLADDRDHSLRAESVRLARILTELVPKNAEVWGLLALLLHTESRRPGRVVDGRFVPLGEQDTSLWSSALRDEANECIGRSLALADTARFGRFQLEAAISAAHSARATGSATDWDAIATLYRGLLAVSPSVGATVGAASALTEAGHPDDALALLDSLPADAMRSYQPYWVCRAHVLRALARVTEARTATERAVGLTTEPLIRDYLIRAAAEFDLSR